MKTSLILLLAFAFRNPQKKESDHRKYLLPAVLLAFSQQSCAAYASVYCISSCDAPNAQAFNCEFSNNTLNCRNASSALVSQRTYNSAKDFVLEQKTLGIVKAKAVLESGITASNTFDSSGRLHLAEYSRTSSAGDFRYKNEKREFGSYGEFGRPVKSTYTFYFEGDIFYGLSPYYGSYPEKYSYDDANRKMRSEIQNYSSAKTLTRSFNQENILFYEYVGTVSSKGTCCDIKSTLRVCY